jgi:hypothetical protein
MCPIHGTRREAFSILTTEIMDNEFTKAKCECVIAGSFTRKSRILCFRQISAFTEESFNVGTTRLFIFKCLSWLINQRNPENPIYLLNFDEPSGDIIRAALHSINFATEEGGYLDDYSRFAFVNSLSIISVVRMGNASLRVRCIGHMLFGWLQFTMSLVISL